MPRALRLLIPVRPFILLLVLALLAAFTPAARAGQRSAGTVRRHRALQARHVGVIAVLLNPFGAIGLLAGSGTGARRKPVARGRSAVPVRKAATPPARAPKPTNL